MDLITPVKLWLRSLGRGELLLLVGRGLCGGTEVQIDGIAYFCPTAWARQELRRRARQELRRRARQELRRRGGTRWGT